MRRTGLAALLPSLLLCACAQAAAAGDLAPIPENWIPTAIVLTLEAGQTPTTTVSSPEPDQPATALLTATPTVTPPPAAPPTASPTLDLLLLPTVPPPTPTPVTKVPDADIRIFRPGDGSRVTSPFRISSHVKISPGGKVWIELLGEDGRVLVEQLKDYTNATGTWASLPPELEFGIAGVAEAGRLVIRVDDSFGRTVALNSVDMILLSMGEADITPPTAVRERILIEQPRPKALIMGGNLLVTGLARTVSELPLRAELIDEGGKLVGMQLAAVAPAQNGEWRAFAAEIPYQVEEVTPARLVVYEDGGTRSDISYLSSIEVVLSP